MRRKTPKNNVRIKQEKVEEIDEKKLNKIDEEIKNNKIKKKNKTKTQKGIKRKQLITNILFCIFAIVYFLVLLLGMKNIPQDEFLKDLINFGYFFLILSIIIFEIAYKKDKFEIALFGIESLVLSGLTLFILDLCSKSNENVYQYYKYIIGALAIYYIIKIIVILVKKKKK